MLKEFLQQYDARQREKNDIANIKGKMAQCQLTPLSSSQKNDIQAFYQKMVGHKVPTYWHEYFYSRNENFSVKYIPTSLYHKEVIYKLNYYKFRHAYVDKSLYDTYFPDVNRPETIVKNINGYFYDGTKPITRAEALERCANLTGAVLKPTHEGMWGSGVMVFATQDGKTAEGTAMETLFDQYGSNFIIQQKVAQHAEMARLNPTSLNTLRIMSYRQGNEVFILYAVVRIGRLGKSVDNETAGGINADVDLATGRLAQCAYGTPKEKKIPTTDAGTAIDGFAIPSFDKALSVVKELHLRLPYFNLIGWDFGIDEQGEPVMIEWNRCPDLSQTAHGPAFGEMTEAIFDRIRSCKNTMFD